MWSIFAILLVCGVAAWGIRMLKQRLDEQRYQEQLAELEFTENLLADASITSGGDDAAFLQTDAQAAIPPAGSSKVAAIASVSASADAAAAPVMNQLIQAGLTNGSIEGYVELHGNSKGAALLRLRNGKLALLVPHMESEAFLRRQARRVDLIIMAGIDGKAVVITPLEQLLSENMLAR